MEFLIYVNLLIWLFSIWALCDSVSRAASELGVGRPISIFLVPWITTAPELITTVKLALYGYKIAGLWTLVGSLVFDLCLVMSVLLLGRRLSKYFGFTLIAAVITFTLLILSYSAFTLREVEIPQNLKLGVCLLALGTVLTLIPAIGPVRIVAPTYRVPVLSLTLLSSIIGLLIATWNYADAVSTLCVVIPERVVGVLNAYLTSIPDMIYSLVTTLRGEPEAVFESAGQLYSCMIHDLMIVPGVTLMLTSLFLTLKDLLLLLLTTIMVTPLVFKITVREVGTVDVMLFVLVFTIFTVVAVLI